MGPLQIPSTDDRFPNEAENLLHDKIPEAPFTDMD